MSASHLKFWRSGRDFLCPTRLDIHSRCLPPSLPTAHTRAVRSSAKGPPRTMRQSSRVTGSPALRDFLRHTGYLPLSQPLLPSALLTLSFFADCRSRISHRRPLHQHRPRQDNLPTHHLGWSQSADLRSAPRSQPRLHHSPSDSRIHHCKHSLQGFGLRSMGWSIARVGTRYLDLQERQEGR